MKQIIVTLLTAKEFSVEKDVAIDMHVHFTEYDSYIARALDHVIATDKQLGKIAAKKTYFETASEIVVTVFRAVFREKKMASLGFELIVEYDGTQYSFDGDGYYTGENFPDCLKTYEEALIKLL